MKRIVKKQIRFQDYVLVRDFVDFLIENCRVVSTQFSTTLRKNFKLIFPDVPKSKVLEKIPFVIK